MELTLLYWREEDGTYGGQLTEPSGVISQGETLGKLLDNVLDALETMLSMDSEAQHYVSTVAIRSRD